MEELSRHARLERERDKRRDVRVKLRKARRDVELTEEEEDYY